MSLNKLKSAVRTGDLKLLKELLSSDPPSSDPTTLGTLLLLACVKGRQDFVSFLIEEKGADVNFLSDQNSGNKFPLMQAVESGHLAIVKQLVDEHHANVDLKKSYWDSALMLACKKGNAEIVEVLLAHSGQTDNEESMHSLLYSAVEHEHVEVALCLLRKGAKIISEKQGSNALSIACRKGNVKMIKDLLENGGSAHVNFNSGWSPLMEASYGGHYEIIELLLSYNADLNAVNEEGDSPLLQAIKKLSLETVTFLIKAGANVNQMHREGTPLMVAIYEAGKSYTPQRKENRDRLIDVVGALLDGGADVNMEDDKKNTALFKAVQAGLVEIIKLLINKGAHINHQNEDGKSPLMLAAFHQNCDINKLLLEEGADINLQDKHMRTPLILAASSFPPADVVQLYLDKGAEINQQDSKGNYALLHAVKGGSYDISDLLLRNDADGTLSRDDGESAANFLEKRCTELVSILVT